MPHLATIVISLAPLLMRFLTTSLPIPLLPPVTRQWVACQSLIFRLEGKRTAQIKAIKAIEHDRITAMRGSGYAGPDMLKYSKFITGTLWVWG